MSKHRCLFFCLYVSLKWAIQNGKNINPRTLQRTLVQDRIRMKYDHWQGGFNGQEKPFEKSRICGTLGESGSFVGQHEITGQGDGDAKMSFAFFLIYSQVVSNLNACQVAWKATFFFGGGCQMPSELSFSQYLKLMDAIVSFSFLYSRTHFLLDKPPTISKHFSYQTSTNLRFMKCFAILLPGLFCLALLAFLSFQSWILKDKITAALEQGVPNEYVLTTLQ